MFVNLEEVFGKPLNEAFNYAGEKEFLQAFEKATGFKTRHGGYFGPENGSAGVKIDLYDCVGYNKHLPRAGKYGDLEIVKASPMDENQYADMVVVYQGVELKCTISASYPSRAPKAKNNQIIDMILKHANIKADYEVVVKSHQPNIELSPENFGKISKIKEGDTIGDYLVYDAGLGNGKFKDVFFIVMTSRKDQFSVAVNRAESINESYDDLPEYSPEVMMEMNEAVNETEFFKAFTKETGLKVGRDSEMRDGNTGLVAVDAYTASRIRFGALKPGTYGKFKVKSVKPIDYRDFEVVIGYDNEDYTLRFDNVGSVRTSAANAKPLVDRLLESVGAKAVTMGKLRTYCVTNVDAKAYNKLKSLKIGTSFGDLIVTNVGERPNGVFGGEPFIVEVVYPKGFAELVFRNADTYARDIASFSKDAKDFASEMSESVDLNDLPEYSPEVMNALNEGMPPKGEALKDAQKYSKFLGIAYKESDDTWNGAGAFFEISQKGLKKAKDKIRKAQGSKQPNLGEYEIYSTGPVVEKLNVDEVEIEDQEGYIRFTKGTKDVYFQADWAEDDKELLNESTLNESTETELNEVTGLPKFKTIVPKHML